MIRTGDVLVKHKDEWLYFSGPRRIIVAKKPDEVLPALQSVESSILSEDLYAAGFLSYEAAPAFDRAFRVLPSHGFPLLWFGLYPKPESIPLPAPAGSPPQLTWKPPLQHEEYNAAIDRIKERIAQGRTYQVNYTMRLKADFRGDAWDFFLHLAQSQNKYAAYVNTGRYVICSASPELFFELDGDVISSRPMKGTVRRGRTTIEDLEEARWLQADVKNRAENVMIVDMIRNDIGRIAEVGSVHVPELFTVEKYPTLFQMTSMVRAGTKAPISKIFGALFPCASITGAPKVSTMNIIAELETTPRNIYTGSIGFISPQRKVQFNVAIRTALIDRETGQAEYGVGGGIVWDSTSSDEYSEALLKACVLTEQPTEFSLLETMLWTPADGYFLLEKHIARLADSAEYFDIPLDTENLRDHLSALTRTFTSAQKVRILLKRDGRIHGEAKEFQAEDKTLSVCLAEKPVDSGNPFLFHKSTRREIYESALGVGPQHNDVLLYNERNELTEFTAGNFVAKIRGKLVTPPVSCGLLAGTFRAHLLETGKVTERVVSVKELRECEKTFLVNSVRMWVKVKVESHS